MGNLAGTITAEPATSAVGSLAEILAEVMKAEQVPVDDHFFDELGADSLVMAKFCARVRKRADLPSLSMKDIYAHPTIRSLAESLGLAEVEAGVNQDAIATLIRPRDPILVRSMAPGSTRQYLMCGAPQLLFFLGYAWVAAIVGARAYEWISAAQGYEEIYLRSVAFSGAGFVVLCTVPILAKWVLIGRWKPQQIRIWSQTDALTSPTLYVGALVISLVLFVGSVLLGLLAVATLPRLLSRFVKPVAVYPLFGFHDRIHRSIVRMTSVRPPWTLTAGSPSWRWPCSSRLASWSPRSTTCCSSAPSEAGGGWSRSTARYMTRISGGTSASGRYRARGTCTCSTARRSRT
jgi:hypothetical protein